MLCRKEQEGKLAQAEVTKMRAPYTSTILEASLIRIERAYAYLSLISRTPSAQDPPQTFRSKRSTRLGLHLRAL